MITVQQIVYTDHVERWHALAEAMGAIAPFPPAVDWAEFDGGGILAVHPASEEHPAGRTDVHLLVTDLDAAEAALTGWKTTRFDLEGVGEIVAVQPAPGISISISAGARPAHAELSVQPIVFGPHIAETRAVLEALGLRADIIADRGGWVEFQAGGGGSVGVHEADAPRIGLGFLAAGDLDALATRLTDAGFAASVVDEAYARTVRVANPDGGAEVWINGVQDDLYGYSRLS